MQTDILFKKEYLASDSKLNIGFCIFEKFNDKDLSLFINQSACDKLLSFGDIKDFSKNNFPFFLKILIPLYQ